MSQEDIFINGELLRLRREARGWVLSDLATRACMSVKQIRQLEEGGMSSFYSAAVKMTSAKKVGALLGLSASEVFAHEVEHVSDPEAVDSQVVVVETQVFGNENTPNEVASVAYEPAQVEVDTKVIEEVREALVGKRIKFVAALTRSDSDAAFAFGKRPTKASFVAA
jgi:transcriptional regulator with XRE-family HTH domain